MLLLALSACGPEEVVPDDTNTITWEAAMSLDEDYTVPAGTTLVIEPGVTVTVAEGVAIVVQGELLAQGTAEAPILFTGDAAAPWRGIVFEEGAIDAGFQGVDVYAEGSIVEHAIVEHATRGMQLVGASPYLHAVTFRDNELPGTVDTIGGAALLVSDGSTARIRECRFEDNTANTFAFGGALYVHHADPIVQDSVFIGNYATYGGAVSTDRMAAPIVGSRFEGNDSYSEGGAISLVSTVSALLGNTVEGNTSKTDGAGIHVCVTCDPHAAPYLFDNVVTGNLCSAGDPNDGAAGVGAAFLGALESNTIHGNLRDGLPSDFGWFNELSEGFPVWIAAPATPDNWWGTTDRAAIDAAVFDGVDSAKYGVVALDPILTEAPTGPVPRAVIASRRFHYEDAGDAVPIFLTLYNPGSARSASVAITRQGAPFDGQLTFPGALRDGDRWVIELPENSVWFAVIDESTYDGSSVDDVTWEATLYEADSDALIGVPVVARYLFGPHGS